MGYLIMKNSFRDHYGHNFELNLGKMKITATNRLSRGLLFFFFIFGLMFFILGTYLLNLSKITGQTDFEKVISKSALNAHFFVSPDVFGTGMIVLGVAIVLVCIFFIGRYKTITIENGVVSVSDHPFIGKPHSFSVPLRSYTGVRLRLKFCQYDLLSRNKFIIELYNSDQNKLVPLYITTSAKNIRSIWKKYALYFNLPPIHISDKGMVSQAMRDLERPYAEVVKDWHLPKNFLVDKTHSTDFICKKKQDKKMIKMHHAIYDLYSTLNIAVMVVFIPLMLYALCSYKALVQVLPVGLILAFYVFLLTCIVYAFLSLIKRDIVLISDKKLVIFRKILGMTFHDASVDFSTLKGLDIFFTPTTGRYCLNVVTDQKVIKIFNKLSPDDLRWIKCFIISEIIQQ